MQLISGFSGKGSSWASSSQPPAPKVNPARLRPAATGSAPQWSVASCFTTVVGPSTPRAFRVTSSGSRYAGRKGREGCKFRVLIHN
jgi:hypothetical protein